MKIGINELIFDTWNTEHIKKHQVEVIEVENSLADPNVKYRKTYGNRIMVLGRSQHRLLATILSKDRTGKYYVVTSRDMEKRERNIYRESIKYE